MGVAEKEFEKGSLDVIIDARDIKENKKYLNCPYPLIQKLTFSEEVKCVYCERKGKKMQTALKFFKICQQPEILMDGSLLPVFSFRRFAPLTPVCRNHELELDLISDRKSHKK